MTTEQKVVEFIAANPFRTIVEETEFIRDLVQPWMSKEAWWRRRYLTKRERSFVAYIEALDDRASS